MKYLYYLETKNKFLYFFFLAEKARRFYGGVPSLIDSIESLIIFINLKSNGVDIMREHSLKYPVSSTIEASFNLDHAIEVDNP